MEPNFYSPETGEEYTIRKFRTYIRKDRLRYTDERGDELVDSKGNPLTKMEPDGMFMTSIQTDTKIR